MAQRERKIEKWRVKVKSALKLKHPLAREGLAEFIGTLILVVFGDGAVAQLVLNRAKAGELLYLSWAWGMAVSMGVWFSGGVSGGHINPAVSVAMSVIGHLPWQKLPVYLLAQYLGAFVASIWVYGAYFDQLNSFDGGIRQVTGPNATAHIWASYPNPLVSTVNGFMDQFLGTALLMSGALAIIDERNMKPPRGMVPFCLGLIVFLIVIGFVSNVGSPLNPARDLSPRIFTLMAGWGVETFSFRNYNWFWVPVIATHLGALFGAAMYLLCVGNHWPDENSEQEAVRQNEVIELCDKGERTGTSKACDDPLLPGAKV